MQPALVHSELHIWFALCLLVDYEHIVLAIIGDPILMYDVAQSNYVVDRSLAETNVFVIACLNRGFLRVSFHCIWFAPSGLSL